MKDNDAILKSTLKEAYDRGYQAALSSGVVGEMVEVVKELSVVGWSAGLTMDARDILSKLEDK